MSDALLIQKPLKILQVLPSLVSGGVERGTLDLAKYLVEQGNQAWVISSGGPLVEKLERLGARHICLPVHTKNPLLAWKNSLQIADLIKTEQFDIVHARSRAPAWSCYWATRKTNTPFITTFHGQYGYKTRLKRFYNAVMLKGVATIAVSEFIYSHILKTYPNQASSLQLIHRGIDFETFTSNSETTKNSKKLREQWKLKETNKLVALPGRLTRIKGHQVFIEAISQLSHLSNSHYLIVGDEPGKSHYRDELLSMIQQKNLTHKVTLTGNCSDMPALYEMSDVIISASIKPESFGRVACEAQAMDCLVVATKHGGSLETIAPMQRKFMCEANDAAAMAKSIETALSLCAPENQEAHQLITHASSEFIRETFSLEKMCQQTLALYREIADRKHA